MWSVIFALIPARYLYGAGATVVALLLGWAAVAHHQHALKDAYFQKGYAFARDSAAEATIQRLKAQHLADEARADSTYRIAQQASAAVDSAAKRLATAPRYQPTIDPLPDSITDVQRLGKVRVIVAATNDTINDVPVRAARYWFVSDSVAYAEHLLIGRYAAANKTWHDAWGAEHEARIGADSLVASYAARLRAVELVPRETTSWSRRALAAAALIGVGMVIHNQLHR